MKHSQPKTVQAVIHLEVPEFQIGQEVSVYFKDTMYMRCICEKPKTGHWIMTKGDLHDVYSCSECGSKTLSPNICKCKFCYNCGAKMESEEV